MSSGIGVAGSFAMAALSSLILSAAWRSAHSRISKRLPVASCLSSGVMNQYQRMVGVRKPTATATIARTRRNRYRLLIGALTP